MNEPRLRDRLVRARKTAEKTQTEVANALGKTQSLISKLETGERQARFAEVVRLARIYRVPITYLTEAVR